jgi:hypothetical protein
MRIEMRARWTEAAASPAIFRARRIAVQLEKIAVRTRAKMLIAIMISSSVKARSVMRDLIWARQTRITYCVVREFVVIAVGC